MIYQTWFLNYWIAVLSNWLLMSNGLVQLYQCYLTFTIVRQLLAWKLTTEYFILSEGQWKSFIWTNFKPSFIEQSLKRDLNQRLLEKLAEFFSSFAISSFSSQEYSRWRWPQRQPLRFRAGLKKTNCFKISYPAPVSAFQSTSHRAFESLSQRDFEPIDPLSHQ